MLSAYLDDALTAVERTNLERRLAADPHLRAELESLRVTRSLLRRLPQASPPRSFTIDPAMMPQLQRQAPSGWLVPLSSGLAGLVLVLIAGLQFLTASASAPESVARGSFSLATAPSLMVQLEAAPTSLPATSDTSAVAAAVEPTVEAGAAVATVETQGGSASANRSGDPDDGPVDHNNSAPASSSFSANNPDPSDMSTSPAAPSNNLPPARILLALGVALIGLALGWRFIRR